MLNNSRNLTGYGATPPSVCWPNGSRVAVNFVLNYEEGSEYSFADGDQRTDTALTEAVQVTNAARREAYARSAQAAGDGATTETAAARMFQTQLLSRISTGQWYRNAAGQWVQR